MSLLPNHFYQIMNVTDMSFDRLLLATFIMLKKLKDVLYIWLLFMINIYDDPDARLAIHIRLESCQHRHHHHHRISRSRCDWILRSLKQWHESIFFCGTKVNEWVNEWVDVNDMVHFIHFISLCYPTVMVFTHSLSLVINFQPIYCHPSESIAYYYFPYFASRLNRFLSLSLSLSLLFPWFHLYLLS